MRRPLSLRRHRPLPEVEARIAALAEELPLTAAFIAAMEREGRPKAALGVIAEQRASLRRAEAGMLRSLATRRRRIQVALSGAVAAMMLASGSYAAVRVLRPEPHGSELVRRATVALDEARPGDAAQLAQIVDEVHETLLALNEESLSDPGLRLDVAKLLGREQSLLSSVPGAPHLMALVDQLAQQIDVTPIPQEAPAPETKPKPQSPEGPAAPSAPTP